jgi:PadR family transcriptional regulator, regulatory protein PadR
MKGDHIGELEELALLTVLGLGEAAYGINVQERLEREARREVSLGAVYAALDRLERKGLVRSAWTDARAQRGGKRRRVFEVTSTGVRTLQAARRAREALWSILPAALRGRP